MFDQLKELEKDNISIKKARTFSQMAKQINNANTNILQNQLKNL